MNEKSRKFTVNLEITDNDPVGDNRDIHAIIEIITREFSYDNYSISPVIVIEVEEE